MACGARRDEGAARPRPGGAHEALRQQRPPAAARIDDAHARPGRVEHPQGGLADARLEEAGERVGHQHHVPAAVRRAAGAGASAARARAGARRAPARPSAAPSRASRGARDPRASSSWAWPARRVAQGTPRGPVAVGERLDLQARDMSTAAGHSDAQALQPRQSSSASCRPSSARPAGDLALERRAQQHGPSARRVALVAERLEARAHRAGGGPAGPVAVARLGGARQPALGGERDRRAPRRARRRGPQAQPLVEALRVDEDPGVEDALRVEEVLELREGRDRRGPEHARQQLAAGPAVPVLARERAAERHDEVGRPLGDAPQRGDRAGRAQIHPGADVQAAHARVAVPGGVESLGAEDGAHAAGELGQPLGRHGRVLDERQRPRIARTARRHPQRPADAGTPHRPHALLLGRLEQRAGAGGRAHPRGHVVGVAAELDDELRRGAGVERRGAHQLDRGGSALERGQGGVEGRVDRGQREHREPAGDGALHQPQLGPPDHRQGALRPAHHPGPVGALAAERLERVARHAAQQRRGPGRRGERPRRLHAGRRRGAATQGDARSVGHRHAEGEHVVGGEAVHDRAGSRRVVGDHPPEGRPAARGDVGPEDEVVRGRRGVEPVERDARADPGRRGAPGRSRSRRGPSSRRPARDRPPGRPGSCRRPAW